MADDISPAASNPVIPLSYEEPPRASKASGTAVVLMVLFICGTSLGLFAIEANNYRRTDSWPAAVAVLGLSLMGATLGYFVTRQR
jgi:hypothetical protein